MMIIKTTRQIARHQNVRLLIAGIAALVLWGPMSGGPVVRAGTNPIAAENLQTTGVTSSAVWDINGAGDPTIQGFATDTSVNTGATVNFKIKTTALSYTIDIYRLGYYGGAGARLISQLGTFTGPQNQPACTT